MKKRSYRRRRAARARTRAAAASTAEQVQQRCGISEHSAMGLDGSGISVAIVSIGSFEAYTYSLWTSCLELDPVVQPAELLVDIDRGLDQEGEVDLDIDAIVAATPTLAALAAGESTVTATAETSDPQRAATSDSRSSTQARRRT